MIKRTVMPRGEDLQIYIPGKTDPIGTFWNNTYQCMTTIYGIANSFVFSMIEWDRIKDSVKRIEIISKDRDRHLEYYSENLFDGAREIDTPNGRRFAIPVANFIENK